MFGAPLSLAVHSLRYGSYAYAILTHHLCTWQDIKLDNGEDLLDLVCHSREEAEDDDDDEEGNTQLYNYCAHHLV